MGLGFGFRVRVRVRVRVWVRVRGRVRHRAASIVIRHSPLSDVADRRGGERSQNTAHFG